MKRKMKRKEYLEIESTVLRNIIESALKDLSDDECEEKTRIISAKFTLAGADGEITKEVNRRYR